MIAASDDPAVTPRADDATEVSWLVVVSARAGAVDADERARRADDWAALPGVLLHTCHRVERYSVVDGAAAGYHPAEPELRGVRVFRGTDAVRHAIEVAVGLDSVVVAEDQVLSQLRSAVAQARARHSLDSRLGHLMDLALRSGRRARSWLPAGRPTLADLAIERSGADLGGRRVLVVGAGRMGELAARAAIARGAEVVVASRSDARASGLAARLHLAVAPLDPGPAITDFAAVVTALSGPWSLSSESADALAAAQTVVIDLSSPPAVPVHLRASLGSRLLAIDDLASMAPADDRGGVVTRLRALTDTAVAEYLSWATSADRRDTAREMAERSERIRANELAALWQRVPQLADEQRAQIERMTERLAARLLQEPLARLGDDADESRLRVARELFGL